MDFRGQRSLEVLAIAIVLMIFVLLELNAVFKGGAQGQDFYYHRALTNEFYQHPFNLSPGVHVDPPLYYGIGALVLSWSGPAGWARAMGVVNVVFNVFALLLLYANATLMIRDRRLRLGLLCLVAFLPAFTITSAVVCPDALTPIWILAALYSVGRMLYRQGGTTSTLIVCTAMAALSVLTKFTAISLIPVFFVGIALFVWCKTISFRQAIVSSLIFFGLAGGLTLFLLVQYRNSVTASVSTFVKGLPLRNVLFLRSADVELLKAPSHWHLALSNDPPSFAHHYRYSYPGLLCLGTFTDVLDFFQDKTGLNQEPTEGYLGGALVGKRSEFHQRLMEIALKGGALWFAATLFSIPIFTTVSLINVIRRRSRNDLFYIVVALTGGAWLGFMVTILPRVPSAYYAGFWLPRLVTPTIVLFLLLFFAGLDQIRLFRLASGFILGLVIVQSAMHLQFLWM